MKLVGKIQEKLNIEIQSAGPVSGGCIAQSYCLQSEQGLLFAKTMGHATDMFQKEARGLELLGEHMPTPGVVLVDDEVLVLEFIQQGRAQEHSMSDFGKALAKMHKTKQASFGLDEDNYLGASPQKNQSSYQDDWWNFFWHERLCFQVELAKKQGRNIGKIEKDLNKAKEKMKDLVLTSQEHPSLIHGDLWSGNFMIDSNGTAIVFDPAVSFAHRELELAMTKMFGGFSSDFYQAYNSEYPLKPGAEKRIDFYQLYHILNHYTLFGGHYGEQALSLIHLIRE